MSIRTARKVSPRTWREEYEVAEALGQLSLPIAKAATPAPTAPSPDPDR
jgi:hypothetical protein